MIKPDIKEMFMAKTLNEELTGQGKYQREKCLVKVSWEQYSVRKSSSLCRSYNVNEYLDLNNVNKYFRPISSLFIRISLDHTRTAWEQSALEIKLSF